MRSAPAGFFLSLFCTLLLAACASKKAAPGSPSEPRGPQETSAAPWYEPEIAAYEQADAQNPPEKAQVLFIGSSSVRMWKSVGEDMAPVPVLNRGFGGSKTHEVLAVTDRIVFPYEPRVIVYYCGDNDLGTDNTDSMAAAAGFTLFADAVHDHLPGTKILYMSIKPSIARWSNWPAMARANALVEEYCRTHAFAEYMDLASPLLGADGQPDPALFLDDGLHLNADGYERWTCIVRPHVLEAWSETSTSAEAGR